MLVSQDIPESRESTGRRVSRDQPVCPELKEISEMLDRREFEEIEVFPEHLDIPDCPDWTDRPVLREKKEFLDAMELM